MSQYTSSYRESLLNLSMEEELVQGSLHLHNRLFSSEISLLNKATQTQLLVTQQSQKEFKKIEKALPILRRYMSADVGEDEISELIQILRDFTEMCFFKGEEQEPHQQNQSILYNSGKQTDIACDGGILHSYLLYTGLFSKIHTNFTGVLSDVLNYVRKATLRAGLGKTPSAVEYVCIQCFKFLKALAHNNVVVQQRYRNYQSVCVYVCVCACACVCVE